MYSQRAVQACSACLTVGTSRWDPDVSVELLLSLTSVPALRRVMYSACRCPSNELRLCKQNRDRQPIPSLQPSRSSRVCQNMAARGKESMITRGKGVRKKKRVQLS